MGYRIATKRKRKKKVEQENRVSSRFKYQWLTIEEVLRVLHCSRPTLMKAVNNGQLPAYEWGIAGAGASTRFYIHQRELDEYIEMRDYTLNEKR
jgi:excisionase family DNA binding protein